MEEIREASERQKMFATQIADYTTLFKIDFDINKFERFEV